MSNDYEAKAWTEKLVDERTALRAEVERLTSELSALNLSYEAAQAISSGRLAELTAERERHRATAQRLAGLRPEFPPMPNAGHGLPRYGLLWPPVGTFTGPLAAPMADGYWTPWHLADARRVELREALGASISHCRLNCTEASYCGQCEPLFAALKEKP